jgi:NDP-sugar pyrophosphorylase family protein
MADSVAAVVLAAGAGLRLRPLTTTRPKVLTPVGHETLLDANLRRVAAAVGAGPATVAVNAHAFVTDIVDAVGGRATVSVETGEALGTAGGIAHLRPWLDGRPVLAVNGDTWSTIDLGPAVEAWDGRRVRVLLAGADQLVAGALVVGSLLPSAAVAGLPHRPAGLYEICWRDAQAAGTLEVVRIDGTIIPVDRPSDHLRANLMWSGGASVVGSGAVVEGTLDRSVVWPGCEVAAGEHLVDAIRFDGNRTVLLR